MVFLDPAKKGLRYHNLKSKTSLLLQYNILVSHKKSLTHQSCSSSLLITSTLLYHCSLLLINICSYFLLMNAAHHLGSSSLLLVIYCCKLSISSAAHCHQPVKLCSCISAGHSGNYLINFCCSSTSLLISLLTVFSHCSFNQLFQ